MLFLGASKMAFGGHLGRQSEAKAVKRTPQMTPKVRQKGGSGQGLETLIFHAIYYTLATSGVPEISLFPFFFITCFWTRSGSV